MVKDYEEQAILGCAVEGDSGSHHGGRHGAGNHVMYGLWPILNKKGGLMFGQLTFFSYFCTIYVFFERGLEDVVNVIERLKTRVI